MDTLLERQRKLMQVLGVLGLEEAEEGAPPSRAHLLEAAIGMAVEASEVLDAMNKQRRPWKPVGDVEAEVVEETIDVIFYALEVFVLLGLTGEQIEALYVDKYKRNLKRFIDSHSLDEIAYVMWSMDYEDDLANRLRMAIVESESEEECSNIARFVSDAKGTDINLRQSSESEIS